MKKLMTIVVSALCAAVAFTSLAETITWTGAAGDGLMETARNWDLNRAPVAASDDIVLPASETPYTVTVKKTAVYNGTLTVGKNATIYFSHGWSRSTVGEYGMLFLKSGATLETGGITDTCFGFDPGSRFAAEAGATYSTMGEGSSTPYSYMGPTWSFPGGDITFKNAAKGLSFGGVCDIWGADVKVGFLSPYDATQPCILNLISGTMTNPGHGWENNCLWKAASYPGSYINFPRYSAATYVLKSQNWTKETVFSTWFKGETARMRYDGQPFASQEDFDARMTVTYDETIPGTVIAPIPEAADHIIVNERFVMNAVFDGKRHVALNLSVGYPHADYKIEYSVDGGTSWSEDVPSYVEKGVYPVRVRVTDTIGALETWEKDFETAIVGQPLTDGGAVALIPDFEFTGEAITPEVVVTFTKDAETVTLVRDLDYTVGYENNVNPGVATAIVTGIGNYSGELKQTFAINATLTDGDIYVDPAAEVGGDGSSWAKAISSLSAVMDMLKEGDRTIYMKGGTQTFLQTIDVSGKANLTIKGGYLGDGFPGSRDPKAHPSILDGQGTKRIMNAEGCVNLTLDGITFANGLTPAGTSGGALRLSGSDGATVVGCTFKGNKSYSNAGWTANGGGAISSHNGGLSVTDCRFEDNLAFSQDKNYCYPWGGAAYLSGTGAKSFVNCVFLRNAAKAISAANMALGGAIATAASGVGATTVDNCLFVANRVINSVAPPASFANVGLAGSAICGDNMTVRNCTIAGGSGAAIVPRGSSGNVSVSNCVLAENGLDLSIKAVDNESTDYSFIDKFTLDNVIVGRTQITNALPANCTRDIDFAFEAGCRLPAGYANIGYAFPADEPAPAWTELYVDPEVAATGDGTAASPFKTLTEAVAAAGDWTKIHLAAGTYSASANGETFPISVANRLGLQILGAANRGSVIDGEGIEKADKLGALISLSESSLVRLSNLKLTGVNRVVSGGNPVGGVLTAWASQLTVEDCEVSGNRFRNWDTTSSAYGVGVTLVASSANFLGTDILDNLVYGSCPNTTYYGIGLMLYDSVGTFERGRIEGNGADAEATLKNTAHRGAGVFAYQSQVSFRSALIAGNTFAQAPCNGAALAASYLNGRGTTANVVLENCTVNDNVGDNVLYWTRSSADTFSLVNTFVGNTEGQPAITLGGSYTPVVLNSAFVAANACFTDGENGNILLKKGIAATFRNASNGDYHLTAGSELIKGGRSLEWFNSDSTDLYGAKRVSGRRVDIGCASLIPGLTLIFR